MDVREEQGKILFRKLEVHLKEICDKLKGIVSSIVLQDFCLRTRTTIIMTELIAKNRPLKLFAKTLKYNYCKPEYSSESYV